MILPIVAYGHPVLREKTEEITTDYPDLAKFIDDMWETMYASSGVGLAAPQVNRNIRLFVVDSIQMIEGLEEDERSRYAGDNGMKQVFINPVIHEFEGDDWSYNEGCLSIPKIREDIDRPEQITIEFFDEQFQKHEQTLTGLTARVVQHEYDHIEGKLFIDYLKPLKRKLMRGKLEDISRGKVKVDYKMMFPKK